MPKPDYARVAEVLAHAHALHGAERDAWLTETCGSDVELRVEVEALLAYEGDGPALLATAGIARVLTPAFLSDLPADAPVEAPETIGAYRILGVLGQGGMGMVYRAQQLHPIVREVAVKLVRRGLDTDRIVARFAAERQALARMDHPGIARVIDAGASVDGRPYFVMELVEGQTLSAFCDGRQLSIRSRLDLFIAICAGVQHAHQRGIIHRDLKPHERARAGPRRCCGTEDHRLRDTEGGDQRRGIRLTDRRKARPSAPPVHEPRTGGTHRRGDRHAHRYLLARRVAVRTADRKPTPPTSHAHAGGTPARARWRPAAEAKRGRGRRDAYCVPRACRHSGAVGAPAVGRSRQHRAARNGLPSRRALCIGRAFR